MSETEQLIEGIFELQPQVVLVLVLNVIGIIMKLVLLKVWKGGTWTIPIVMVLLGGILFTVHVAEGTIVYNSYAPGLLTFEIGCLIGAAAIASYELFLRRWTDPILKKIVGVTDDPARTMPDSANGK